jgi:hypothetical protein
MEEAEGSLTWQPDRARTPQYLPVGRSLSQGHKEPMTALPPPPAPTVDAIYRAYESRRETGWREHLGASQIGADCERALWYDFRWVSKAAHAGRILRLFETGQLEEARLVANLRAAGVTVLEKDPETGRQWSLSAVKGHFGGSMDAVALGLLEAPKTWHLVEFKTHSAKSFADLKKKGVALSKPVHFAQMQVYMHLAHLERGYYLAVCKDTDELWSERVKPDEALVIRLMAKAQRIIDAPRPPAKLSTDPSYFICRWCDHATVCHESTLPPRNCRTCLHSTPVEEGRWSCDRTELELTREVQQAGCLLHLFIPDLVAGEQVDAGDDWVSYRMPSGQEWRDGIG